MRKGKVFIAAISFVALAGISFTLLKPAAAREPGEPRAVLSEATPAFQRDLQSCLAYNHKLYEHDRQKIERGDASAKSNPKEVRLQTLEDWYWFEQEACRESYQDRIKNLSEQ